jgi:hypothetical protein
VFLKKNQRVILEDGRGLDIWQVDVSAVGEKRCFSPDNGTSDFRREETALWCGNNASKA